MKWTLAGLADQGFRGFVRFAQLSNAEVPPEPGVYAIVRPDSQVPVFSVKSTAGWFKGKDPAVALETLRTAWVPEAQVLYIGKAGLQFKNCLVSTSILCECPGGEPY